MRKKILGAVVLGVALISMPISSARAFTNIVGSEVTSTTVPTDINSIVLEPKQINTYDESLTNVPEYNMKIGAGYKEVVVPIEIPCKGVFKMDVSATGLSQSVTVGLYSDADCKNQVGYSGYLYNVGLTDTLEAKVVTKGTYYIKAYYSYDSGESDVSLLVKPYIYSGEDKTLVNKKWIGTSPIDYNEIIYHKIVVDKTGYIKVEGMTEGFANALDNVILCDSKKSVMSESQYLSSNSNENTTYFAVKKGTYYISVKNGDAYKLKYTFTAVTDKGGATQAKATNIKKGSTIKGLIQATDKTTKYDWYKITLTKKQKINLDIIARANERLAFKVIPANKNTIIFGDTFYSNRNNEEVVNFTSKDSFNKGTYYIRVSKTSKNASGYYAIKFK